MTKLPRRQVLIAEEVPVIQNALFTLAAGIESKGGVFSGTRDRLERIAREGCGSLILDLRAVGVPLGGVYPMVRNVRATDLGAVVVVTCDVAAPQIFDQIKDLCRPHFYPRHWTFSLAAFVHAFLGLF